MTYGDVVWVLALLVAAALGYAARDVISVWRHGADTDELLARTESREHAAKEDARRWKEYAESLEAQQIKSKNTSDGSAAVYSFVTRERRREYDSGGK